MPKMIKINVTNHRLIDNNRVIEDVTSVTLPTFEHPTTTVDTTGIAMALDVPDPTRFQAAQYQVAHNNGSNTEYLATPNKHITEFRTVRQKYNTSKTDIQMESVKYRLTGLHKSTDKGSIETGNPWGSTETYSLVRYEEIVDGKQTMCIDGPANIVRYLNKDYSGDVESLLS